MSKNKKNARLGEIRKNKQGLTMQIVKYVNNKCVTICFIETGEEKVVRYDQFARGIPLADLLKFPPSGDCTIKQGIVFLIGIVLLIISAIGGLIYWLCV